MSVHPPAPALLLKSVQDFLCRHLPFAQMSQVHIGRLTAHAKLSFFAHGERVLGAADGAPQTFYVIQRGEVRSCTPGTSDTSPGYRSVLMPGECFPLGALIENRPLVNDYVAAGDTFCYEFDKSLFDQLLADSPPFASFCTQRIAHLLQESRRQAHSEASEEAHARHNMTSLLASLVRKQAVTCAADTPIRAALTTMRDKRIGSIVAVDESMRAVGIFTERDVLNRIVLEAIELDAPLSQVMTPNPVSLDEHASAFDAALMMARHGIRHLPVTRGGKLVGVVSERDLFSLQRSGMREVSRSIDHATDAAMLEDAASGVRLLARSMLAQGMAVEQLTQLIVVLNDRLTNRAIELVMRDAGIGEVDFVWIALGSEGRLEQTVSTDQDNGLIFLPPVEAAIEPLRARLVSVAHRINQLLSRLGFPLCKGGIMAGNPAWCLTLAEWKSRFAGWLRNPTPDALLHAAIFFDFRPLYGNAALAENLRNWLLEETAKRASFLHMLAANALGTSPPLNFFGDITASGTIDLKGQGARPFIDAARVLSLARNISATHTAQRLRLAAAQGSIANEIDAMIDAFHFIQTLRLARQFKALEDGGAPNEIEIASLNELDRRILKEAFRQARKLQQRLRLDYAL